MKSGTFRSGMEAKSCNVMPNGSICNDADKTMFLAMGCRSRMIEGKKYDREIALIP